MTDITEVIRDRRKISVEQGQAALNMVPQAEREVRRQLLSIAGRMVDDQSILNRWLELAFVENDYEIKKSMLLRLASLEISRVQDIEKFFELLIDVSSESVSDFTARSVLLSLLIQALKYKPSVVVYLIEAYKIHSDIETKRLLLNAMISADLVTSGVEEFFFSVLGSVGSSEKIKILRHLLRLERLTAEQMASLLRASEPEKIREIILLHIRDRSIDLEQVLIDLIRIDRNARIRKLAIEALASGAESLEKIELFLSVIRNDSDYKVRQSALEALACLVTPKPEIVDALLAALQEEQSLDFAHHITWLLIPFSYRSKLVRDALCGLLKSSIDTSLAAFLYKSLGRLAVQDKELLELFIDAFTDEDNSVVRSAILEGLYGVSDPEGRLDDIYLAALNAPESQVRAWGLLGTLSFSMAEDVCRKLEPASKLLLDSTINEVTRAHVAQKVALIHPKSPELISALIMVAQQGTGRIREICQDALDRTEADQGQVSIDWQNWYRRVDVDKDVRGVIPEIFTHYDENPEAAKRILKATLSPGVELAYEMDEFILRFLVAKNAVDDDISRYCVSTVLNHPHFNKSIHIATLKSNPSFSDLRDSIWQMIERVQSGNLILLRELLIISYGSDRIAAEELEKRISGIQTESAMASYLTFIRANVAWEPLTPVVKGLLTKPFLIGSQQCRHVLQNICMALRLRLPSQPSGPGLADD